MVTSFSFCKDASADECDASIRAAVKNHGRITKEALMGEGWDRHLFGLRKLAEEGGDAMPEIFTGKVNLALNVYRIFSVATHIYTGK